MCHDDVVVQPHEHLDATLIAADTHVGDGENSDPAQSRLDAQGWKYAVKRTLGDILPDGLLDLAALLTFFSLLSLAPALLLGYSIITLVLSSDSVEVLGRARDLVSEYVPEEQAQVVLGVIDSVAGSATGGRVGIIVGLLVALWTSSAYVRAFSRCANAVYGRTEGRGLLKQWGMMLLLNFGLLLGAIVIVVSWVLNEGLVMGLLGPIAQPLHLTSVLTFLTEQFLPIWVWVRWPVIVVVLIIFVATLYHWAPNARPWKFRWLSTGSVFAIVGIIIVGGALNLYFTVFAAFNAYGAVSSVLAIIIALWIFNTCLILGLKIDVEIGRARQLKAGLPAEEHNLVPPRDIEAVTKLKQRQQRLVDEAKGLSSESD